MLLVSSCVPVITWLCSRVMRFQSWPTNWPLLTKESPVAQWLEHPIRSRRVMGSNPIWDSDFFPSSPSILYHVVVVSSLSLLVPKYVHAQINDEKIVHARLVSRNKSIYYSTNCNTIQIWSWCSRYLSSVGNRYPAIYVASYVGRKSEVKKCRQKDLKMLRALLSICWIIKQLSCSILRNIVWF